MLDLDHGTFPYVTSSNTTAGGVCTGTGLSPREIHGVMGVTKAYTTRVGEGPFPTEDHGQDGEMLRKKGGEYGATTGRPRRCGWLDAVVAKYATRVNGLDAMIITKLDVLDSFEEIKVCVAYEMGGEKIHYIPASVIDYQNCRPVYDTLPGWRCSTAGLTSFRALPSEAKIKVSQVATTSNPRLL